MTKVHRAHSHFPHTSFFFLCVLRVKVVLDEGSHSTHRGVDWMFWSPELLKNLGEFVFCNARTKVWLLISKGEKHWIAILYKIKAGRTLAACLKSRVSHMLNDTLAFLLQECILDTVSEAYTVGGKCSDVWQEGCRQWSAEAATVLQRLERTVSTVTQVSARSPCCRDEA